MVYQEALQQLLELGADPNAGTHYQHPIRALPLSDSLQDPRAATNIQLVKLLLRYGADPLKANFMFSSYVVGNACFEHLEQQRQAGAPLQVRCKLQAMNVVGGAARRGLMALLLHFIPILESLFEVGPDGHTLVAHPWDDWRLNDILMEASHGAAPGATLPPLLASRVPFDLAFTDSIGCTLLERAAMRRGAAVSVPLLHRAGAPLNAETLLVVVQRLQSSSTEALAGLFACAPLPAVDTSRVALELRWLTSFSCPVHRALHAAVSGSTSHAMHCGIAAHMFAAPALALPVSAATVDVFVTAAPADQASGLWADRRVGVLPRVPVGCHAGVGAPGGRWLPSDKV